jgi:hypothetical protein
MRAQKSEERRERAIQREKAAPLTTTFTIQIWIRQKWIEVPFTEGTPWAKYRRYLKRRFTLKQWRWSFEESISEGGWCHKLPNPFALNPERKYRIVLHEKPARKPRPGKQTPRMTREQRMRPKSRGARQAPANPWTWSPPQDEKPVQSVSAESAPPPKPTQVVKPVSATQKPITIERKRTAADFAWSPQKMVNTRLVLRYADGRSDDKMTKMVEKPTISDVERTVRELFEWQGELTHLSSDMSGIPYNQFKFRAGHPPAEPTLYTSGQKRVIPTVRVGLDCMSTLGLSVNMTIRVDVTEDDFLTAAERTIWPKGSRLKLRLMQKFIPPTQCHIYCLEAY